MLHTHTHTENEDYEANIRMSTSSDFDPAYPQVFLLTSKWYKEPDFIIDQLVGLYPVCVHAAFVWAVTLAGVSQLVTGN